MAHSFIIYYQDHEIPVIYNESTQSTYRAMYGVRLNTPDPKVSLHQPDSGPPVLVDAVDGLRQFFLEVDITAGDWDGNWDAITDLRRALGGAHSTAVRAQTVGDADPVTIGIQLDGATYETKVPVLYGFVDDSRSHYIPDAVLNTRSRRVIIGATVEAYSTRATYTLKNYCINPETITEGATSGLAADWTLAGGTPTLDATYYLIGGKSQKVAATNIAHVLTTPSHTATNNYYYCAYIWIALDTSQLTIQFYNATQASVIGSAVVVTSANIGSQGFRSITKNGKTWYKIDLADNQQVTTGADTLYIRVIPSLGSATYYADVAYIGESATAAPVPKAGWTSYYNITFQDYTTTTTPERVNYVDVWDIPGDANALLRLEDDYNVATATRRVYGAVTGYSTEVQDIVYVFESDELFLNASSGGGSYTQEQATGATYHGGSYGRYSSGGAGDDASIYRAIGTSQLAAWANKEFRLFALVNSSTADPTIQAWTADFGNGFTKSIGNAGSWEVVDLGLVKMPEIVGLDGITTSPRIGVQINDLAAGATFDIDALLYMPANSGFLIGNNPASESWFIDGANKVAYSESANYEHWGELYEIPSGDRVTRIRAIWFDQSDNSFDVTETTPITLKITPRSSHLFGLQ